MALPLEKEKGEETDGCRKRNEQARPAIVPCHTRPLRPCVDWFIGALGAPQQDGTNLQGRAPFVFEYIEANPPKLVHIWVIDFSQEPDLKAAARGSKMGLIAH